MGPWTAGLAQSADSTLARSKDSVPAGSGDIVLAIILGIAGEFVSVIVLAFCYDIALEFVWSIILEVNGARPLLIGGGGGVGSSTLAKLLVAAIFVLLGVVQARSGGGVAIALPWQALQRWSGGVLGWRVCGAVFWAASALATQRFPGTVGARLGPAEEVARVTL